MESMINDLFGFSDICESEKINLDGGGDCLGCVSNPNDICWDGGSGGTDQSPTDCRGQLFWNPPGSSNTGGSSTGGSK